MQEPKSHEFHILPPMNGDRPSMITEMRPLGHVFEDLLLEADKLGVSQAFALCIQLIIHI
jgi:hypothetical protein